MKRLLYGLLIGAALMVTGVVFAAPSAQNFNNIQPFVTDTYNNGSTLLEWLNTYTKTLCISGDCKSAWPGAAGASWNLTTGLFNTTVLAPTSTVPIYVSSTATSTIANLGGTLDATAFATSSSDLGSQIMAAYNSSGCSINGCNIHVPAGTYNNWTTPINISTVHKPANIICDAGVTYMNYSGTATSTIFNPQQSTFLNYGMFGCTLIGTGSSGTQVGVQTGGSNGSRESILDQTTIKNFNVGWAVVDNGYMATFQNGDMKGNQTAFMFEGASNAGEQINILNSHIVDNNNTASSSAAADCIWTRTSGVQLVISGSTIDNCQVHAAAGTHLVISNSHIENSGGATVKYDFVTIDKNSNTINVALENIDWVQVAAAGANLPNEYIYNGGGGGLKVSNVSGINFSGVPTYFVYNATTPAYEYLSGIAIEGTAFRQMTNNSQNVITETTTGNLGIGTSTPSAPLGIMQVGSLGTTLKAINFETDTSGSVADVDVIPQTGGGQIQFNFIGATSGVANWLIDRFNGASNKWYWGDTGTNAIQESAHPMYFISNTGTLPDATFPPNFIITPDGTGLNGNIGVASTSPFAKLSVHANDGDTNTTLFAIGSSTQTGTTTLFSVGNTGSTTLGLFGTCSGTSALTTNSSGTIVCGAISGAGGAPFPFTPSSYAGNPTSATTTSLWVKNATLIASSTFFSMASTTNFEMTYYVQNFPGASLGTQFNNAYAAAPKGSTFVISASSTFSTAMNMGTAGKVGTIKCSPGVILTWTGAATSTILNATDINNLQSGWGMTGCTIKGVGGAGQVLVQLGGSNGGQGAVLSGNDLQNAHRGLQTEQNTWNINVENNWFGGNDRAVWIESANNSGEGFRFRGNTYADCNNTYGDCFFSDTNGSDGLSFEHDVWDDAGVHLSDGNLNATFLAPKFENPNAAAIGRYTYMTFDAGGFMMVSIFGGDFMNGAADLGHSPNQFILNGAQLTINGTTFDNNTGGAVSVPAIVNNHDGGAMSIYDYRDINSGTATFGTIATSSIVIKADSFNNLFAVQGTASSTSLVVGVPNCNSTSALTTDSVGNVACGVLPGATFPFTPTTNFAVNTSATSTILNATAGIQASSTSKFAALNSYGAVALPFDGTGSANLTFGVGGNTNDWSIGFAAGRSMLGYSAADGIVLNGGASKGLRFIVNGTNSTFLSGTTALTIMGDPANANSSAVGNVGIGTTTPFAKFAIHAQFNSSASSTLFAIASSTVSATSTLLKVNSLGQVDMFMPSNGGALKNLNIHGTSDNATLAVGRDDGSLFQVKAQDTGQTRVTYSRTDANTGSALLFDSDQSGTLTMALTGSNTVGIASSTPTATLGVAGTVSAKLTTFASGDSAVCQRGAGGLLTFDSGVTTCAVSSMFVKDKLGDVSYADAKARIDQVQVIEFKYKDTGKEDIGAFAEDMAKIDPRYAEYETVEETIAGHTFKVGDPKAINWSAVQADMIVVLQHQSAGNTPSKWPYATAVLLIAYVGYNEWRRKYGKK